MGVGGSRGRLGEAAAAFASNWRNPNLRRAQLSFLGARTAEWAFTVALGIVAYTSGGALALGPLKFVAHVGEVATQSIRGHTKLVGIDVILVHRLLKNSVSIPEYVLVCEELYHVDEGSLPTPVHEITSELEGIGEVRAYFVDVADLDGLLPPPRKPSWGARIGNTFAAVGQGMPYMLGMKQPRKVR